MPEEWRLKLKDLRCEGVLGSEDLQTFMESMSLFDKYFSELMGRGVDFTLKMEVRGNKGNLIHCRVHPDAWIRPGKEKGVDANLNTH